MTPLLTSQQPGTGQLSPLLSPLPSFGPQHHLKFGFFEIQIGRYDEPSVLMGSSPITVLIGGNADDVLINFGQMVDVINAGGGNDLILLGNQGGYNQNIVTAGYGADTILINDNGVGYQATTLTDFRSWEGDQLLIHQQVDGYEFVLDGFEAAKYGGYSQDGDLHYGTGAQHIKFVGLGHELVDWTMGGKG